MSKRARLIHKEDGTVVSSTSKYNGKYLLENLLVCGDCGASYRRRTERGKVVWRCAATRIEKGKESCVDSPTVNDEWVQKILGGVFCEDNVYNEDTITNNVQRILLFKEYLEIYCKMKKN
ncbi:zinc ribbon domain-containing protein [Anaerocolumna jejuensis]|uniref:zinc ribbon domain-containing protein n=1 Tax=Anaerocolumna jejuensis TaxID=259063 RepID=UPI003F7B4847